MRYFMVNSEKEVTEVTKEDYDKLFSESETEETGYAKYVDDTIIGVDENDNGTLCMYRIDNTWYSVPKAFETMTIHFKH